MTATHDTPTPVKITAFATLPVFAKAAGMMGQRATEAFWAAPVPGKPDHYIVDNHTLFCGLAAGVEVHAAAERDGERPQVTGVTSYNGMVHISAIADLPAKVVRTLNRMGVQGERHLWGGVYEFWGFSANTDNAPAAIEILTKYAGPNIVVTQE